MTRITITNLVLCAYVCQVVVQVSGILFEYRYGRPTQPWWNATSVKDLTYVSWNGENERPTITLKCSADPNKPERYRELELIWFKKHDVFNQSQSADLIYGWGNKSRRTGYYDTFLELGDSRMVRPYSNVSEPYLHERRFWLEIRNATPLDADYYCCNLHINLNPEVYNCTRVVYEYYNEDYNELTCGNGSNGVSEKEPGWIAGHIYDTWPIVNKTYELFRTGVANEYKQIGEPFKPSVTQHSKINPPEFDTYDYSFNVTWVKPGTYRFVSTLKWVIEGSELNLKLQTVLCTFPPAPIRRTSTTTTTTARTPAKTTAPTTRTTTTTPPTTTTTPTLPTTTTPAPIRRTSTTTTTTARTPADVPSTTTVHTTIFLHGNSMTPTMNMSTVDGVTTDAVNSGSTASILKNVHSQNLIQQDISTYFAVWLSHMVRALSMIMTLPVAFILHLL